MTELTGSERRFRVLSPEEGDQRYSKVMDRATEVNDAPSLQQAIDSSVDTGKPLVLRRGAIYRVSNPLVLPSNITIEGNGAVIRANSGLNTYVITNSDRVNGNTGIKLRDLTVEGNGSQQSLQFNTIEFMRVSYCRFENLDVSGALRNQGFPNGTNGDGLCLIYSHYNEVVGGYFHHNVYDGIKLRSSNWNRIIAPLCDENGRSGIQLAFYSPTGPPFNEGEGIQSAGSNHNTVVNPVIRHSTGIPHPVAPTTSGVYIHTGYRNTVVGIQAHGVRQGIGIHGGAWDNQFIGGLLRINWVDYAAISIDQSPDTQNRNSFTSITTRALSGVDGKHVSVNQGSFNRFHGCYFAAGDGTGTWTVGISPGVTNTWFFDCFNDGALNNGGTGTLWRGPDMSAFYNTTEVMKYGNWTGMVPGYPTFGVNQHVSGDVLRWRFPNSFDMSMGAGGVKFGNGGGLPPAVEGYRGQIRLRHGAEGTEDMLYICRKTAADTYEWTLLT